MVFKKNKSKNVISNTYIFLILVMLAWFAVLLVSNLILSKRNDDLFHKKTDENNSVILTNFKENIDGVIQEALYTADAISRNKEIRVSISEITSGNQKNLPYIQQVMKEELDNSRLLQDISIICGNEQTVLTHKDKELHNVFYYSNVSLMQGVKDNYLKNFNFKVIDINVEQRDNYAPFIILKSIVDNVDGKKTATLVMVLKRDLFVERLGNSFQSAKSNFYAINPENGYLYRSNELFAEQINYDALYDNARTKINRQGKTYSLYAAKSLVSDVKFILITEYTNILKRDVPIVVIMLLLVLAAMLVAINRIYRPVRLQTSRVLKMLAEQLGDYQHLLSKPNFESLELLVKRMIIDREKTRKKLAQHESFEQSEIVWGLFFDRLSHLNTIVDFRKYNIEFTTTRFLVLVYYHSHLDEDSDSGSYNKDDRYLIRFVVDNIMNEHFKCFTVERDDRYICLLNIEEGTTIEEVIADARVLIRIAKEELELNILAAFSEVKTNIRDISAAYQEASKAHNYQIVYGGQDIYTYTQYSQIREEMRSALSLSFVEKQYQLVNCCKSWKYKDADDLLNEIFDILQKMYESSFNDMKLRIQDVYNAIIHSLISAKYIISAEDINTQTNLKSIGNCQSGKRLRALMQQFLIDIDTSIVKTYESKENDMVKKIDVILEKRFNDVNLSVSDISYDIGISVRTLSTFYKKKTGMGLHERITGYRMEKAKALLKETELMVSEVAEKIGYDNTNTFIRVFKTYVGTTPGGYRDSYFKK